MSTFEERRQARIDRLTRGAERAAQEAEEHYQRARKMGSIIPMGQPILVGHHSEKADRRYRARIEKQWDMSHEKYELSKELERRAEAAANNAAIFSDDPDAAEKLEDRIHRLEQRHELMKAANKLIRANDYEGLRALGFDDTRIAKLLVPDYMGRVGFPGYSITNNGANIRRLKKRLGSVQAHANDETSEQELNGVRIVDSVEDNRLQVFFPGKPAAEVRTELKSYGFRWAPSLGCWQRNRSPGAEAIARRIVDKFYPPN